MKYTRETLELAIDFLMPKVREAKKKGIDFNLQQLLSMVAEDYFVNLLDSNWSPSHDYRVAIFICQEALKDLKTVGYMTFGEQVFEFDFSETQKRLIMTDNRASTSVSKRTTVDGFFV